MNRRVARERCAAWERMHRHYFPDYHERWQEVIDVLTERYGARDAPRILDLGCGPGTLTHLLHRSLPQATVIGIDADPLLIELARRAHGWGRGLVFHPVRLFHPVSAGDAGGGGALQGLGRFDAIVSSAFMHYFDVAALRELHRALRGILRPEGVLLTVELFAETSGDRSPVGEEAPAGAEEDPWARWWEQTHALFPRHPAPLHEEPAPPLTAEAYREVLADSGFTTRESRRTGASRLVVGTP